jgi:hypothetical protein
MLAQRMDDGDSVRDFSSETLRRILTVYLTVYEPENSRREWFAQSKLFAIYPAIIEKFLPKANLYASRFESCRLEVRVLSGVHTKIKERVLHPTSDQRDPSKPFNLNLSLIETAHSAKLPQRGYCATSLVIG